MKAPHGLVSLLFVVLTSCAPEGTAAAKTSIDFKRVATALEPVEVPGIDKIHTVSGVYLAGQPDESGFAAAKDGGIQTVINLRHADEIELDEKSVVEGLGLTYLELPWNGADELNDDVFDRAREMLRTAAKPVLLHCKSANRVGAVWLPHRVLDDGLSVEDALQEAKAVGLKEPAYETKALDYIERKQN